MQHYPHWLVFGFVLLWVQLVVLFGSTRHYERIYNHRRKFTTWLASSLGPEVKDCFQIQSSFASTTCPRVKILLGKLYPTTIASSKCTHWNEKYPYFALNSRRFIASLFQNGGRFGKAMESEGNRLQMLSPLEPTLWYLGKRCSSPSWHPMINQLYKSK